MKSRQDPNTKPPFPVDLYAGMGLALGAALGVVVGVLAGGPGIAIAIGIVAGAGLGLLVGSVIRTLSGNRRL